MSVDTLPWFADIVNYLVTGQLPEHWTKQDMSKFLLKLKSSFGMILIYLNIVLFKLLGDVSRSLNFKVLFFLS